MKTSGPDTLLHLLSLEDNENDKQLLKAALEADRYKCQITHLQSREAFAAILKQRKFDLIISDFTMPSFDGMSALGMAKKLQPDTPFILLTGTIGEEQAVEIIKAGAADCVLKANLFRIGAAVRRALREADEQARRKHTEDALRALAGRLQASREEERLLISREIHDDLGEALTTQKLGLGWLRNCLNTRSPALISWEEVFAKIDALGALADATANRVRKLCTRLRPAILDDLGLAAAIEWQAQEFQSRTGIRYKISQNVELTGLENTQATAVFRIFQEILTNIARHSRASRTTISLKKHKLGLVLQVRDNGKGITKNQVNSKTSLGILGMRERAMVLGGEIEIQGKAGVGTLVVVTIPLVRGAQSRVKRKV